MCTCVDEVMRDSTSPTGDKTLLELYTHLHLAFLTSTKSQVQSWV